MANVPIMSLECDIIIEEESLFTQTLSNAVNNATITLDNRGNLERNPIISITLLDNALTNITITNTTTSKTVTITKSSGYVQNTVLTVYNDSVYVSGAEVSATFSSLFNISENAQNTLRFNVTPASDSHIDVSVQWVKPSGVQRTEAYIQGFNLNQTETVIKKQINKLNKYTNDYFTTEVNYDLNIDRLFWDDYYFEIDTSKRYRITWKTDVAATDINQYTYYLCGCKFNSIGISQSEVDMIKEGLRGNACKLLD
jgi:hypothetical protein